MSQAIRWLAASLWAAKTMVFLETVMIAAVMNGVGVSERRGSEHLVRWVARIGLLLALSAGPALAAPTIDGLVQASDMYDFSFTVTFGAGGPSTDQFGTFHVHDNGSFISVGLVAPVELDAAVRGESCRQLVQYGSGQADVVEGEPR